MSPRRKDPLKVDWRVMAFSAFLWLQIIFLAFYTLGLIRDQQWVYFLGKADTTEAAE